MMVTAERFADLGGLSELYLEDGDEIGDFCLALIAAGAKNWVVPDSSLHLLERRRRTSNALTERFNDWLFDCRWGALLRSATGDHA
jgi:hypothetical protein